MAMELPSVLGARNSASPSSALQANSLDDVCHSLHTILQDLLILRFPLLLIGLGDGEQEKNSLFASAGRALGQLCFVQPRGRREQERTLTGCLTQARTSGSNP